MTQGPASTYADRGRVTPFPIKPGTVLSLWKGEIDVPWAKRTMAELTAQIALSHGLQPKDLTGPSVRRDIAWARQEAMYTVRQTGRSFSAIGRFFGRDHTTVIYACKAFRLRSGLDRGKA